MNSPGLTLVLADRDAVQRVVHYGFGDLEARLAIGEDDLFQIGSISKSFVALALLQLRDEGKLDLDRPIVDYLPWLRIESKYAPITVHHLLTHSTGLPGAGDVFQVGSGARAPRGLRARRAFPLQQRDVRRARHPRLDPRRPRAAGAPARADPAPRSGCIAANP